MKKFDVFVLRENINIYASYEMIRTNYTGMSWGGFGKLNLIPETV